MWNNPQRRRRLCERADLLKSQNLPTTSPNKHSPLTHTPKAEASADAVVGARGMRGTRAGLRSARNAS